MSVWKSRIPAHGRWDVLRRPEGSRVVTNGATGGDRVMVRMSLAILRKVFEESTVYEHPTSPTVSWDGKEIRFIARRPGRGSR